MLEVRAPGMPSPRVGNAPSHPPGSRIAQIYRSLHRIRRVEEEIARVYPTDKIKSPVHLSIGQEAVSVGVCEALRPDDVVFGTYRGHAAYLAKGGDLNAMIAELYGKVDGCARGKAGSMHLIDVAHGVMGMSAVVATTIPQAAGYAYALKLRGNGAVVACFLGDGSTEEGVFYETLNFAALKALPVLFVCENNGYAIHSAQAARQKLTDITAKALTFGVTARHLDDDNVFEMAAAAEGAVAAMRRGGGPWLLEVPTYRWREHVGPAEDFAAGYRSQTEAQAWMDADQVALTGALVAPLERMAIEATNEAEIQRAFAFAETSPFPAASELLKDVYAE